MKILPLSRQLEKPVGYVTSSGRVLGDWGSVSWDALPSNAVLYYGPTHQFLADEYERGNARRRLWKATRKKNGPNITTKSYTYRDRLIRGTRDAFEGMSDDEAAEALCQWAEFFRAHGANVGSIGGTPLSLFRATLTRPITETRNQPPADAMVALLGSRQDNIGAGSYDTCEAWDISSAYPHALGTLSVPSAWNRYRSLPDSGVAFVNARVTLPNEAWGPLPIHERGMMRFPRQGEIEGWWSLEEIQCARDIGADVDVIRSYVGIPRETRFAAWWEIVKEGRKVLPPAAARLLKASVNTLWATFAAEGQAFESWREGTRTRFRPIGGHRKPQSLPLSALVSSRVRARVFRDALSVLPVASVHTDGVILLGQGYNIEPNDGEPGSWRLVDKIERLKLTNAQVYVYRAMGGREVYKHSGTKLPEGRGRTAFALGAGVHRTTTWKENPGIRLLPDE